MRISKMSGVDDNTFYDNQNITKGCYRDVDDGGFNFPETNDTADVFAHCLLESNDKQCGYIFFNEDSRILKFHCTFCQNLFDSIDIFCNHLGEHIDNEELAQLETVIQEQTNSEPLKQFEVDIKEDIANEQFDSTMRISSDGKMTPINNNLSTNILDNTDIYNEQSDLYNDGNCEMIEEVNDEQEICAEVEAEMRANTQPFRVDFDQRDVTVNDDAGNESGEQLYGLFTKRVVTPTETQNFGGITISELPNENLILSKMSKQTTVRPTVEVPLPEPKKKKKVTTIKVINVRNRVADLYKQIKMEEQKRLEARNVQIDSNANSNTSAIGVTTEKRAQAATKYIEKPSSINSNSYDHDNSSLNGSDESAEIPSNSNSSHDYYERTQSGFNLGTKVPLQKTVIGETVITYFADPKMHLKNKANNANNSATTNNSAKFMNLTMPSCYLTTNNLIIPNDLSKTNKTATTNDLVTKNKPATKIFYPTTNISATKNKLLTTKTLLCSSKPYHRKTDVKDCTCPACGKEFRSSFSLSIHKRTHYLESKSDIKLAHKCADCNQLFNKITELREHVNIAHFPEGFLCKICNKELSSITMLEMHMRKVHLNRPITCIHCKKSFANRFEYETHVTMHNGCVYNYRCRICGRKYTTESTLNQHMKNHKEPEPQCCVVCGKVTLRITQHMKIHAPRPIKVFTCTVCAKQFKYNSALSHHMRNSHDPSRLLYKPRKQLEPNNTTTKKTITTNAPETDSSDSSDSSDNEQEHPPPSRGQPALPLSTGSKVNSDDYLNSEATYLDDEEFGERIGIIYSTTEDAANIASAVERKEEEAKRVIVELIENARHRTSLPENHTHTSEGAPPIAREETISAVSSIINEGRRYKR